ncbi:hypothetical protein EV641_109132 [Rhodococcus sp. SMB37]|uniref:hypothetical protein n=1 Tax=Rhodococcus sp. SMB37 TaxID=2512213 RepID=UPI0006D04472|nr:hypothetical protein [Rhodococcus sp. SMB37]TCN51742.1 hypothetical protein EV641_109132 [Rhodococcus sp. SMB37]
MTRFRRVPVAAAAAAAIIGLLGACAPGTTSDPTPSNTPAPPASEPVQAPGGVTEAQAADLCTRIEGQLQSWRTYTPSVGKGGLNILVGEWGAANGIDLIALAGDRARVDTITSEQCSQVRDETLTALQIPDLASALVGF